MPVIASPWTVGELKPFFSVRRTTSVPMEVPCICVRGAQLPDTQSEEPLRRNNASVRVDDVFVLCALTFF